MNRTINFSLHTFVVILALSTGIANAKKIDGDKLLSPEHLPLIRIEIANDDWDKLRVQAPDPSVIFGGRDTNESPYSYFKADIWIDDVKVESVGIRKKGFFGSADSDRPSLKIKFDEFVEQDPVKGLSRLTLNNNKQDRSQLNQFVSYKLFRDAGVHAPRSNLARVSVNGTDLGIYTNVESIKKPFLQNSFGEKTGNLYEGTLTDFHPKTIAKIEVKNNQETNDLNDVARLIDSLSAEGELDVDQLGQIVNLDHFMRYWAIEGMIRFWDGYSANQNNFYVYVNPVDGLGYFIPWGADSTLGDGGPFARFSQQGHTAVYAQSILANRLYKSDGVPERYLSKSGDPIPVSGFSTIGPIGGFGFGPRQSLNGTLNLSKSGMNQGDEIVGSIDAEIVETHGGIFNAMQGPPGPPGGPGPPRPNRPPGRPPLPAQVPESGLQQPPQRPIGLIELLDEDDNGKLSSNEIEVAVSAIRRLDQNNDGDVTAGELLAAPKNGAVSSGQTRRNRFNRGP